MLCNVIVCIKITITDDLCIMNNCCTETSSTTVSAEPSTSVVSTPSSVGMTTSSATTELVTGDCHFTQKMFKLLALMNFLSQSIT